MAEQRFKVSGMHCTSCAMLIDEEIEDLPGVEQSSTSYTSEQLQVRFDQQQVSSEQIVEIVAELGYEATPLESTHAQ